MFAHIVAQLRRQEAVEQFRLPINVRVKSSSNVVPYRQQGKCCIEEFGWKLPLLSVSTLPGAL